MPIGVVTQRQSPPVAVTDHARRSKCAIAEAADHVRCRIRIAPSQAVLMGAKSVLAVSDSDSLGCMLNANHSTC